MRNIIVRKYLNKLNKASCSCGYVVFATTGAQIDYLASTHAKLHDEVSFQTFVEDVLETPRILSPKPGRHSGSTNTSEPDGGHSYFS